MKNKNCLAGFRCPKCGQRDIFNIGGRAMFEVTDAGADAGHGSDIEWGDEDICYCAVCGRSGAVGDFRKIRLPRAERNRVNAEKRRVNLIRRRARDLYGCDEIRFDRGDISVSEGDDGAFVAAWVWVGKE